MSNNPEIKSLILYQLMSLAIYYNRWYAMGIVKRLFSNLEADISVQSDLAIRLRNNRLRIYSIFESENQLPAMIKEVYQVS